MWIKAEHFFGSVQGASTPQLLFLLVIKVEVANIGALRNKADKTDGSPV